MSERDWPSSELGIDPTDDERAIKRAYAVLLKKTRPQDDPDGYQRLRTAYDSALHSAKWEQDANEEFEPRFEERLEARLEEQADDKPPTSVEPALTFLTPKDLEAPPRNNFVAVCDQLIADFDRVFELSDPIAREKALASWIHSEPLDTFAIRTHISIQILSRVLSVFGEQDEWNKGIALTPATIKALGQRFSWLDDQIQLGNLFERHALSRLFRIIEPQPARPVETVKRGVFFWLRTIAIFLFFTWVLSILLTMINRSLNGPFIGDAQKAFARGETAKAVEILRERIDDKPRDDSAHILLAALLIRDGKSEEACAVTRVVPDKALNWNPGVLTPGRVGGSTDYDTSLLKDFVENAYECEQKPYFANDYAWFLATSPNESVRNGADAVYWVERAELGSSDNPAYVDTAAAAYAEAGDLDRAVELESRAINMTERNIEAANILRKPDFESRLKELQNRLVLYQQGKPFRTNY